MTEGGTLVPAFIHSIKNTIASKKFDGIFHVTDWFPTILKLAKKPKKTLLATKAIDGLDQSRILTNSENNDQIRNEMIYGMIGNSDFKLYDEFIRGLFSVKLKLSFLCIRLLFNQNIF